MQKWIKHQWLQTNQSGKWGYALNKQPLRFRSLTKAAFLLLAWHDTQGSSAQSSRVIQNLCAASEGRDRCRVPCWPLVAELEVTCISHCHWPGWLSLPVAGRRPQPPRFWKAQSHTWATKHWWSPQEGRGKPGPQGGSNLTIRNAPCEMTTVTKALGPCHLECCHRPGTM